MSRIINVNVLAETCVRAGLCVETCPQVFEFPPPTADSPSPAVIVRPGVEHLYQSLEESLHQAARDCPVHAIVIERG